MARPTLVDLTTDDHPWRRVPMDGANTGIDVVPLASHPDDFVLLARFPAGFERAVPGGYHAAETFLVLDGSLQIGDLTVTRGDLTHLPAHLVRAPMRTAGGCTALAWFSGPATFLDPGELGECELDVRSVRIDAAGGEGEEVVVLDTPEARWSTTGDVVGEAVDLALTRWSSDGAGAPAPALVRTRR